LKERNPQNGEHRRLDFMQRRFGEARKDEIQAALPPQHPEYQGLQEVPVSGVADDCCSVDFLKKRFKGSSALAQLDKKSGG
jgi:hypothetical protein